ncbi:MAG: ATP-binding cassette domain-containing protein [Christensenellales bacterium]|jgi:ABC-type nitrate/sulfonate/bicarbonate transport system ATPase subunit
MRFEGLNAEYGGQWILKDFCVSLPDAGRVCFFGPSGCGKTTLLRALSDRMTQSGMRVAWVFQEDRLLPWASALDNVLLGGANKEEAMALLSELGLKDAADKRPGELSGGMKRRVALARALAFQGDAMILDEPFKGLDAESKGIAAALLLRLGPPLCLLVTHDREEATLLADRVLFVDGPPLKLME